MNKEESKTRCIAFYNKANLLHKCSKTHPENPERLNILIQSLSNLKKNNQQFEMRQIALKEGKITEKETQDKLIQLHGESYWQFVKQMWHEGIKKPEMYINIDTYFMKDTYLAALQAARTTIIAASELVQSKDTNCFAIVRPPGHHSGLKTQPHGFSFFNNVALAANHVISQKKVKKVVILDWDVHHGEGTQKLFYNRNDVLYISLHRFDNGKFFPHIQQSSSKNVGNGAGLGYNINICWNLQEKPKGYVYKRQQTCGDQQYSYAFNKIIMPVISQFEPDLIFISCGFDSAHGDPIGGLALTSVGYTLMLQKLMSFNKKILLVLEGGYNHQVLVWAAESIIKTLTHTVKKQIKQSIENIQKNEPNKIAIKAVEQSINEISKYWSKI